MNEGCWVGKYVDVKGHDDGLDGLVELGYWLFLHPFFLNF